MKKGLSIIVVSLFLSCCAMPQTDHNLTEKFEKAGLISAFEKKEFLKELKAREAHLKKLGREDNEEDEKEKREQPHYPLLILTGIKNVFYCRYKIHG